MPKIPPNQHTAFLRRMTAKVGEPILEYVKRRYEGGDSQKEIMVDLGTSSHPMIRLMDEAGVVRRSAAERVSLHWDSHPDRRAKTAQRLRDSLTAYYAAGGINPNQRPDVREKMRLAHRGHKNPNWNPRRTPMQRIQDGYRGPDWKYERQVVLERDGHRCKICNVATKLMVHHITRYELTQDNRPENLVTLCNRCHKRVEWGHLTCPLPM